MADVPEDLYDEVVRRLMRCPAENAHISISFLRNALADVLGGDEELRAALAMVYAAGRLSAVDVLRDRPPTMDDSDWTDLADGAAAADWDPAIVRRREKADRSITHMVIGAAFQHGWRRATAEATVKLCAEEVRRG